MRTFGSVGLKSIAEQLIGNTGTIQLIDSCNAMQIAHFNGPKGLASGKTEADRFGKWQHVSSRGCEDEVAWEEQPIEQCAVNRRQRNFEGSRHKGSVSGERSLLANTGLDLCHNGAAHATLMQVHSPHSAYTCTLFWMKYCLCLTARGLRKDECDLCSKEQSRIAQAR